MMKKTFGQTVRDLRRGVNKKVLKVPSIEQKVLDATSNEPWGPHGSILADIAQATRNYHEYHIIMSIIWKRINDTGKNWRHVYKALTVLDYLIANGSERVIDEIREHAYQISTLSDFQYIDSSGRDQGSNVRKKSQSLVVLVNDKERIEEVREKAAANREKYRSTSMGGMYRPGSHPRTGGYGERYDEYRYEGRYGGRDEEMNGYGRERDWGSRNDDRYGIYGDSNSHDGDRYGRDYGGRYGRDGYGDDDSRERSPSVEDHNHGFRSRSSDTDRDRSYEDDDQYTSRGSAGKADGSRDGRRHDQKYSEQEPAAPPSYEEAVGEADSPAHSERNGESSTPSAPKSSSPLSTSQQESTTTNPSATPTAAPHPASEEKESEGFDMFDPRGSFTAVPPSAAPPTAVLPSAAPPSAAPPSSNGAEVDLFGASSDPYNLNSLAVVPSTTAAATSGADAFTDSGSGNGFFSNSTAYNQPFEDPFGDGPFKAISSTESFPAQQQNVTTSSFQPSSNQSEPQQPTFEGNKFDFGETDILADILPPSGSSPNGFSAQNVHSVSQTGSTTQTEAHETSFQGQINQPATLTGFQAPPVQSSSQTTFSAPVTQPSSMSGYAEQVGQPSQQAGFHHGGQYPSFTAFQSQPTIGQPSGFSPYGQPSQVGHNYNMNFNQQPGSTESMTPRNSSGPPGLYSLTNPISQSSPHIAPQMQQAGSSALPTSASSVSTDSLAIVPQPAKDKFETKSTIWKDTLNRGLVNLNISGSKTNPLADIGVDFDAINRKEKRMEKPSQTPVMSTVTMGRAMGSGSGIGRAGASALRPAPNPMTASGMHIGMGAVPGAGMGMGGARGAGMGMGVGAGPGMGMGMPMGGGYGMNQPMGGMGIGMGMNQPMVPRMNMGVGQGVPMQQQPTGFSQVPSMPGGYNPMMGMGNYSQQPYNGSYR